MARRWALKELVEADVARIEEATGLMVPLARVLAMRGLKDGGEIDRFLSPKLGHLSDPYLLPEMEKAVTRIWRALDAGEPILVFGDYDVDGVTSGALLVRVLRELGAKVDGFIPDRLDEGYGLSLDALERCLERHTRGLLITVDCGVNAVESVAVAQAAGLDVIVTDHHEPGDQVARAYAVINPKLGAERSLHSLAGVGVAFKLAHGLVKQGKLAGRASAERIDLRHYMDMVALGTVADLVPLVGENRVLVRFGLERMDCTRWAGLRALKDAAGMRGEADTYHLGFQLGPRINAAGRIGQPMEALRLLTTDNAAEARRIADLLNRTNLERRALEQQMAEEAFAEIDSYFEPEHHFGLVVARAGWHPGVVGIVASRVSNHYNRPAIVIGVDEMGVGKGSCRSIEGFDLLAGLQACEAQLIQFGGHKMAAGIELSVDQVEPFRAAFGAVVKGALCGLDLTPVQYIDGVLEPHQLNWELMDQLKRLRPFGQRNPEPVWVLMGIEVVEGPRVIGKNHLKFSVHNGRERLEAVAFNYTLAAFPKGPLDLAFVLKENEWGGRSSLQLQVCDIRAAQGNI
jgi:single-stranded-DNA-specific exonuclease